MSNEPQTISVGIEQINNRRWGVLAVALNVLLRDAGYDAKFEIVEKEKRLDVVMTQNKIEEKI